VALGGPSEDISSKIFLIQKNINLSKVKNQQEKFKEGDNL